MRSFQACFICIRSFNEKPVIELREYSDRNQLKHLILILFLYRGNYQGENPYEIGDPCSKCTSGSASCEKGLCGKCVLDVELVFHSCVSFIFINHLLKC